LILLEFLFLPPATNLNRMTYSLPPLDDQGKEDMANAWNKHYNFICRMVDSQEGYEEELAMELFSEVYATMRAAGLPADSPRFEQLAVHVWHKMRQNKP
jgi:hypothetical protein